MPLRNESDRAKSWGRCSVKHRGGGSGGSSEYDPSLHVRPAKKQRCRLQSMKADES
jgi:hypothetical protein